MSLLSKRPSATADEASATNFAVLEELEGLKNKTKAFFGPTLEGPRGDCGDITPPR